MNPLHVLNNSRQFFVASKQADERHVIDNVQFEWLSGPAIVCGALSIELALKAIILTETTNYVKGHALDELYGKLSPASQQKIAAAVTVPTYPKIPDQTETFNTAIAKIRDAFIVWRYIHEKTDWVSIDHSFLMEVAAAAQAVAAEIVPRP